MDNKYLLKSEKAQKLYMSVKSLPIIDYHCHLSPKEIYEDLPFDNIGEMWLSADHYKWRLMRTAGIDEKFITGNSTWHEKFLNYAKAIEFAAGNPLYHWTHMELSEFFKIDEALNSSTAEDIWCKANKYIKLNKLSPKKLILQSNVEVICTTDDIISDLSYHKKIREDKSFKTKVIPSFRNDNLLLVRKNGYLNYIQSLEIISGITITDYSALKQAIIERLDFFVQNGCKFTDVGIPVFPDKIADECEASLTFSKILDGKSISDNEYKSFIGNMYLFFAKIYKERNLVMQWHLAVYRNANSLLFEKLGADCGVDCVGDEISGTSILNMLDAINQNSGLPRTIIYTLNPSNAAQIASIAGSFPGVICGAAWWFCDHKKGIEDEINIIAENSSLGSFYGMLTDSRSFLSYARHDYFRRILCNIIANWINSGEYDESSAYELVKKISYYNIKKEVGE